VSEPENPSPADGPVHHHRQPRTVTRKQLLIGSAALVVVIAGASVATIELTGPHYKQPWFGSVEATLNNTSQTQGQYEAALASEGAPVSQVLTDVQSYDTANASEQSANDFQVLGAIGSAMGAANVVGADLQQIDRECGVPVSAAGHQGI
jgi:hypothetical protein